jgi:adenine-specific DNA methylase
MSQFRSKAVVSADKIRGGYYTPPAVARFLARWVAEAGPTLLEPSCGDGRVLSELAQHSDHVLGIELLDAEAEKSRRYAPVENASMFDWLTRKQHGRWDGVAGNPPYIRFGNWPEQLREPALRLMKEQGLKPSKLTNAWVPFVVASTVVTRPGGRVALVLPAELLQVTYAAQLRDYLLCNYAELTIVTFQRLVFEGILQEVVLLLGVRGEGPARIKTVHLAAAANLDIAHLDVPSAPALLHEHEKWTKYFLDPDQIQLMRDMRAQGDLTPLGQWASVDVGIVTGRNSFFTFTDQQVHELGLARHCLPLVSRSSQLNALVYDDNTHEQHRISGHRTWILNADPADVDPDLRAHINAGEAAEVHTGYKCSIRTPWWRTPSVWTPDAFMLRQIHLAPRIAVNSTSATSTDTVHRVRLINTASATELATAFHNSATFAFTEVMGRSYGGGILELEPREAELLPIPDPHLVNQGLAEDVDLLLRAGDIEKATDLVDRAVLIDGLGWSQLRVDACRQAWLVLRDRRATRGRKTR